MKQRSTRFIRRNAELFCRLRTAEQLAKLLETDPVQLPLLSISPDYNVFKVPKKDGSKRLIEDPVPVLKIVQRKLNHFLQSVYFFEISEAAYGFVIGASDWSNPRNILTNAQKHLGCRWLYNADVEDFFHKVTFEMVYQVFTGPPFKFDDDLARLLTMLTTFHERLPMGAPTSPVLSNFACRELDRDLGDYSEWMGWTYTRFADDMSFSSQEEMMPGDLDKIRLIVEEQGLVFNPQKIHLYGPGDEKTVTGLVLDDVVRLPAEYFTQMENEIQKLANILSVKDKAVKSGNWLENYKQQVEGMITFAAFVSGDNHPGVQKAEAQMMEALYPKDDYESVSWLNFGYF
ncbi:MAG: reverse transcriptase family protein [Bacteroidia bacterium]|nr:reverse transcriptase family protein [Bacteroidia bacterium]